MALNRWVATRAPASIAWLTTSYVASVCPTAAAAPAPTTARTASRPWSSSGASVTIRTVPRPAWSSLSTTAGSGAPSTDSSWAPLRTGEIHGPSKWTPAISPSSTMSANARTSWSISSMGPETRLATRDVVPCIRWVATNVPTSSGSAPVTLAPPPPWLCMSTNPGTSQCPSQRWSGSRGGPPAAVGGSRPGASARGPAATVAGHVDEPGDQPVPVEAVVGLSRRLAGARRGDPAVLDVQPPVLDDTVGHHHGGTGDQRHAWAPLLHQRPQPTVPLVSR